MVEDKWSFKGTPWEFVHLVRHAYTRIRQRGIHHWIDAKNMAASRFLMICRRLSLLHGVVLFYHECIEIFLKMALIIEIM